MPSGREEPSWEPSPGLEKSTPQLLGCSTGRGGGGASLPPGDASPGPWTPEKKQTNKKKRREANFYASVVVKVSFLPYFLFFFGGDAFSAPLCPVLSLGQKVPWRAGGVWLLLLCLAVAWDAEGDAELAPYQFCLPGREGGRNGRRERFLGQALRNSICRAGWEFRAQLCLLCLQFTALPWQLLGLKVGF